MKGIEIARTENRITKSISNKIVNLAVKQLKYIQVYIEIQGSSRLKRNIHGIHDTPINIFSVIDAATTTISGNLSNDNIELLYDDFENEANFYPAFQPMKIVKDRVHIPYYQIN